MFHYQCRGTCSTSIDLEIQDGIITYCKINNGCRGNTQGVAKLAIGRKADEIADMLSYALTDVILENPHLRRPVVKALRRVQIGTLPEILRYWLEGWPFTVIGAAILFGIVYGFAALMHALGA